MAAGISRAVEEAVGRRLSRDRLVDLLALLLALRDEGVAGRPRLQRLLGIGERRVRNLLSLLRGAGLVESTRAGARLTGLGEELLSPARLGSTGERSCCLYRVGAGVAEEAVRRVVALRDLVALSLGDPSALLVLGSVLAGGPVLPGLPEDLAAGFLGELRGCLGGLEAGSVFAVFARPRCYRCCAAFIHASDAFSSSMLGM